MKVCNTCGETYGDDTPVCTFDGAVLVDQERNALLSRETASFSLQQVGSASPRGVHETPRSAGGTAQMGSDGLAPGTVLGGRYVLSRQIGAGGFGVVYEAEDRRLKKRVAVKVLSSQLGASAATLARFQREAVAASQAGHEGIALVTDCDVDVSGDRFIVMELLEGEDLAQILRREGPLPLVRALSIAQDIASALAAAHAKGIVHRDLKPRNVFMTSTASRKDVVKVLDFGISKMISVESADESLTLTGQVVGTPHYMAPEQADGEWAVDQRADVYALGVILFEMLTKKRPFGGDSVRALFVQKLAREAPSLAQAAPGQSFPAPVEALVARALARDPAERIASMEALGKGLRACLLDPGKAPPRRFFPVLAYLALPVLVVLAVVVWPRSAPVREISPRPQPLSHKDEAPIQLQAGVPPPDRVSTVEVLVHLKPSFAVATLDGAPVRVNPLRLLRGSGSRELRASAPGYREVSRVLHTDSDQVISLSLKRQGPAARPIPQPEVRPIEVPLEDDL